MGRIGLAFKVLFNREFYERVRGLLSGGEAKQVAAPVTKAADAPARSEAVTLLSVLQREARLVDFLKEEIGGYQDAQIGAAVRDVHRDARAALDRCFGLRPVLEQAEGSEVPLGAATDAARIRVVGNVGGDGPAKGKLQHGGWQATKVELPQYTGSASTAYIIAPAEVEV